MKRIVAVTGSAGYIGTELVKRLELDPAIERVICLDRNPKNSGEISVDLAEVPVNKLAEILAGVDTLFHLAAARSDWGYSYSEYERDNVLVTRSLIKAATIANVRKWVYFGTVGVYGPSSDPLDEQSPFMPSSDYAATKAKAEIELVVEAKRQEWEVLIIRPSAVFSECQPENTNIHRLIIAIRKNRFFLIGNGAEIKTISYLHNLVDATMWLFSNKSLNGEIEAFNYVDEPKLTTKQLVTLIRIELKVRLPLLVVPLTLVEIPAKIIDRVGNLIGYDFPITSARIRKFCTATNFDCSKIKSWGFVPRYTSEEAIKRTVNVYVDKK